MEFGSVCSGIEAASVAFAPLGWKAAWLAEVDVAAAQVLAYRLGATAPQFPLEGTEKSISRLKWGDHVTNYGDMTVLPGLVRARKAKAPAMLAGGTPCQAFSIAGRRDGLNDARGQLTLSFVDLADAIDEVRADNGEEPCIVYWENVPGALSDKTNAFGCFLAGLAGDDEPLEPGPRPEPGRSSSHWTWDKEAGEHRPKWPDAGCAFGPTRAVAWRVNDAQYFGLAQRRRRIVVVASAREGFDPGAILLEFDGLRRDSAPSREAGEAVAGTLDARTDGGGFPGSDGAAQYHVVPHGLGEGRTGVPAGLKWPADIASTLNAHFGDKWGLEDQHVNQGCPLFVPHPICFSSKDYGADAQSDLSPTLRAGGHLGSHPNAGIPPAIAYTVALRGRDGGATAELGDDLAGCLRASGGGGDKPHVLAPCYPINPNALRSGEAKTPSPDAEGRVRLRNPGLGIGKDGDPADTLTAAGPGYVAVLDPAGFDGESEFAPVAAVCVTGEITHTLKADGFDGSEDGTGRGQPIVVHGTQDPDVRVGYAHTLGRNSGQENALLNVGMAVRRLMPIECHRLQGFPDGWCAVPTGPKGDKIASDGPQYKQLGNSWAVNHARWVGYRIAGWLAANPPRPVITMDYDPELLIWAMVD